MVKRTESRLRKLCVPFFAVVLVTGCATTTDPRRGGLFSYNPREYQERSKQREKKIDALEEDKRREMNISRELEDEARAKQAALAEQEQQLASLDEDIAHIQRKIDVYSGKTQVQAAEKARIEKKLRLAQEQVKALQAVREEDSSKVSAAMATKIQQLKHEIEELLQLSLQLTKGSK